MHEATDRKSFTSRFQTGLAEKMKVRHVVTVNSGTSALITALVAAGVMPGDEVLIPAYTWVSTAIAPLVLGAIPILVDIDETLTMDPADIRLKITPYTKAIIPVHMLNLVCDMDQIKSIARQHGLMVIEDACQAVGVMYKGNRVGSIGDLGAFSFNHYKNLSAGEGGAVLTNSDYLQQRAAVYHDIGTYSSAYATKNLDFVGCNMRVSELTGAVLLAQLSRLDGLIERRMHRRCKLIRKYSTLRGGRVSPHNDPDSAVGLTVTFEDIESAKGFSRRHSEATRIADIARHDYVSWLPVIQNCRENPKTDPFRYAKREVIYHSTMCSKTLDILSRTCVVN
jgi:dTDP-4-amino-4,6-dideoxygalactose transaminase